MFQKRDAVNPRKTAIMMLAAIAIGIATAVLVGQLIFDTVFKLLHPAADDFWQNLVTLAIAAIATLIVGGIAFGIVCGLFFRSTYGFRPSGC